MAINWEKASAQAKRMESTLWETRGTALREPSPVSAAPALAPVERGSTYLTGGGAAPAPSYGAGVQARELKALDIKPREKKTPAAAQKAQAPAWQGLMDLSSAAQRELSDMETTQRKKLEDAVKREIKAQEAIRVYDYPDSQEDYNAAVLAAGERIGAAQAELDALNKTIAAKRGDIQTAKQMRWASVSSQPDFEVYAAKGAALPASVNPTKGAKENHDALKAIETGRKLGLRNLDAPSAMYGEMTDEETRVYHYLLAKDQERGTSEAQEYWQHMVNVLKDRRGRAQADEVKNFGLFRPVSTAAYGLAAGLDRGISGIAQNFSDTPIPPSELQYGAAHVRSDLEGVGPEIFGNSLGQVGFDLANTVGNMAPSVAVGTAIGPEAALATTFLSAGGNAYGEALSQGYGQKEARAYGILSGASEAGLQYVLGGISSLGGKVVNSEAIQASLDNIRHAVLRIPAKYAVAAAGEMTEEYLQEILNPVFRNLALGENNEFKPVTEEAAYAALLAALSVGVMEGPSIVSGDKAAHGVNIPSATSGVEGLETQKAATDGVAAVKANTTLFDRGILNNLNRARTYFVEYAKAHFPQTVKNQETGKSIGISRKGIDKFLSGRIGVEKYASGFHIPELIERAHRIAQDTNTHTIQAESIPTYEYYDSPIQIEGVDYMAHIRVRNTLMGDKYYGHTISEVDNIEIELSARTSVPGESPAVQPVNAIDSSTTSIPQPTQEVNPSSLENPEQAGTLLSEAYDLARRIGLYGKTGLSEALGVRKLGGDFDETDFLIGYLDVYLAARSGVPHGPAYLPATVDSHARQLTLVERMQAYHNGLNDAKARTQAAREGKPETGITRATQPFSENMDLQSGETGDTINDIKTSWGGSEHGEERTESRQEFRQRSTREGITIFEGSSADYGYKRVEGTGQRSGEIQEELKKLGIKADITDGTVWRNQDGISSKRAIPEAATVGGQKVLISDTASLSPKYVAGHEAFHFWKDIKERQLFIQTLEDNLDFTSRAFLDYQSAIAQAYFGEEIDLTDRAQIQALREELFAYLSGDIHEGENDVSLRAMFRDFDTVKKAWDKLIQSGAENSGQFANGRENEIHVDEIRRLLAPQAQGQALPQHKARQESILTQEGKPDTIVSSGDDIQIGRSLGAAAFRDPVRLPDGRIAHITEGSKITKVVTFAGGGTGKSLHVAQVLAKKYHVDVKRWTHRRGDGFVDVDGISEHVELHWFEHPDVGRIKMKVKRYFEDES